MGQLPRMTKTLVMTVLGADRPGLVKLLSDAVAANGGNWLDSRMARLAGQFAGIVRVECPADSCQELIDALQSLAALGLTVHAVPQETPETSQPRETVTIDVVAQDRPGIVRELAAAISHGGGNVEEFTTGLESAAMSGLSMFRARGVVSIAAGTDPAELTAAIEKLGGDLSVEIV